jgi:hypothetical protein
MRRYSPQQKAIFHEAVLDELLEERVVSSRHPWNPQGIERMMSNYRLRSGQEETHLEPIQNSTRILKWTVLGLALLHWLRARHAWE